MDDKGRISCDDYRDLNDLDRFDARMQIIELLKQMGLYEGAKNHEMRLAICSRTGDIIEPFIMPQWYLKCSDMAKRVLELTEAKKLTIQPQYFRNQWFSWLNSTHDWCLSRQLWWGHTIPAFKVTAGVNFERWIAASTVEEAHKIAQAALLECGLSGSEYQLEQVI